MPNTQTSVPAFTSGQVLTAQQQTEINTGIPVFATTTTRDAAFGGTGEKTLAEGQFAYIEATNTTQYYDGSAWQTLGASGLTYITGAAFSGVSSVSFANGTFSSTYRNYKVIFSITSGTNAQTTMIGRLRASGTDDTTANYSTAFYGIRPTAVAVNVVGSAQTSFNLGSTRSTTVQMPSYSFDIYAPQVAVETRLSGTFWGSDTAGADQGGFAGGAYFGATTQFDSMSFIVGAGTITGAYRVYGYSES